jgi:hypothetical protein
MATKKARKDRSDITVGKLEEKHGMPPGTIRNLDGRDTRSDKQLGTIRKSAAKNSNGSATRPSVTRKSAAKSAALKAFQMTYDNAHAPKADGR